MLSLPYPYQLRPMALNDVLAVLAIEREVQSSPWTAASFDAEIQRNAQSTALVLTAESHILGYIVYWLVAGELQIHNIAIDPVWRGRGFGAVLLLNGLFDACERGAELATLEVRRSNEAAQVLYRRYGFTVMGERKGYYRDNNEDALLMTAAPLSEAYRRRLTAAWEQLQQRISIQTV